VLLGGGERCTYSEYDPYMVSISFIVSLKGIKKGSLMKVESDLRFSSAPIREERNREYDSQQGGSAHEKVRRGRHSRMHLLTR